MAPRLLEAALAIAAGVPLIRCAWCVVGLVRMFGNHARARRSEWGWLQWAVAPEAYVLAAAAVVVGSEPAVAAAPGAAATYALIGAGFSLAGLALSVWTFSTFPAIGSGHYVAEDQVVIRRGPYALFRHPTYVGVLAIWLGLAVAYRSGPVLALALVYSLLYARYARSEERMMLSAFGDEYATYRREVGGFVPKLLQARRWRAPSDRSR